MTLILIVIDALKTIRKGLVKEQEGLEIKERAETIQTIALFSSVRILRLNTDKSPRDLRTLSLSLSLSPLSLSNSNERLV